MTDKTPAPAVPQPPYAVEMDSHLPAAPLAYAIEAPNAWPRIVRVLAALSLVLASARLIRSGFELFRNTPGFRFVFWEPLWMAAIGFDVLAALLLLIAAVRCLFVPGRTRLMIIGGFGMIIAAAASVAAQHWLMWVSSGGAMGIDRLMYTSMAAIQQMLYSVCLCLLLLMNGSPTLSRNSGRG